MINWNGIICAILGALLYYINSEILSTWSHALVGLFSGLIFIVVYWLLGNKTKMWIRVAISVAVAIAAAAIVRLFLI